MCVLVSEGGGCELMYRPPGGLLTVVGVEGSVSQTGGAAGSGVDNVGVGAVRILRVASIPKWSEKEMSCPGILPVIATWDSVQESTGWCSLSFSVDNDPFVRTGWCPFIKNGV
jgi:hypothetical protein